MDREMTKITKELIENGYSSVRHSNDGEYPDKWFVFAVWKSSGEKNLWLNYEWRKGIYHFYTWNARKNVKMAGKSPYDVFRVKNVIQEEFGRMMPLARRVGKKLLTDNIYITKNPQALQLINEDYDTFVSLVSWFCDGRYDEYTVGLETEGKTRMKRQSVLRGSVWLIGSALQRMELKAPNIFWTQNSNVLPLIGICGRKKWRNT